MSTTQEYRRFIEADGVEYYPEKSSSKSSSTIVIVVVEKMSDILDFSSMNFANMSIFFGRITRFGLGWVKNPSEAKIYIFHVGKIHFAFVEYNFFR